jgi:hypothetical protein
VNLGIPLGLCGKQFLVFQHPDEVVDMLLADAERKVIELVF